MSAEAEAEIRASCRYFCTGVVADQARCKYIRPRRFLLQCPTNNHASSRNIWFHPRPPGHLLPILMSGKNLSRLSNEPRACNETQARTYIHPQRHVSHSTNQKCGKCGENSNSLKVRHATKRFWEIKGEDRQRRCLMRPNGFGGQEPSRDEFFSFYIYQAGRAEDGLGEFVSKNFRFEGLNLGR